MEQRPSAILRIAAPLRSLVQRFMYLGLIAGAFGLMLIGKIDAVVIDKVRAEVTNVVAPILLGLSQPIATINQGVENVKDLTVIREENLRLQRENARLLQWQMVARKLEAENAALKALIATVDDKRPRFISARVIAGTLGAFSNTMVVNAGSAHGLKKGQAVLSDAGLVGRVIEVSNQSARVLLLTDINSRIPVVISSTRTRAIMAGNNTTRPKLIHMSPKARVSPSERIVTSGQGGAFPPGLPVGVVAAVSDGGVEVQLNARYHQIEFVRVADFGLAGFVDTSILAPGTGTSKPRGR
jgi:rod shape-determining protein MreC